MVQLFINMRIKRFKRLVYKQFRRIEINPKVDVNIEFRCHGNLIMHTFKFYPQTEYGSKFCIETGWAETGSNSMTNLILNLRSAVDRWILGIY